MTNRRDFIKLSSLASGALLMPNFLQGLGHNTFQSDGKKLIIIQQSGGNDGLNTFIPYRNDHYYKLRPQLALQEALVLDDHQGLNPALKPLMKLFERGEATLLNHVGYPNPNRSHFRSMDIWHSGSDSNAYWNTGWLGRYLDHSCRGCASPHQVVEISDTLSLAVKGAESKGLGVRDPRQLYRATQDPYLQVLSQAGPAAQTPVSDLDYMYKTLTETVNSTAYIYEKSNVYRSKVTYPNTPFGKQLKLIAELICSGVDTQVFYTSLSGFDTHVNQRGQHDRLLGNYAKGVAALVEDLKMNGQLDDTLIVTFSEFGRRVAQNAGRGTDHGKANNMLLIGGKLKTPGIYNPFPNLSQLDKGDLAFQLDFRQVYATILKEWLGADDQEVLGQKFKRLPLV